MPFYKKLTKNVISLVSCVALALFIIILIFVGYGVYKLSNPIFKTVKCGDKKFSFGVIQKDSSKPLYVTTDDQGYSKGFDTDLELDQRNFFWHRVYYTQTSFETNDEISNKRNQEYDKKKKKNYSLLLSCGQGQNLDFIYRKLEKTEIDSSGNYKNKYSSQDTCYLANYSKVTDYPDCSPEIKARFGLGK